MSSEQEILIALGGNLASKAGAPARTLRAALASLAEAGLAPTKVSRFFATPCFPEGAGPDYVNACAVLSGNLPPAEVLARLHDVEAAFGRLRTERWGGRSLDLDLLAMGDMVLPDPAGFREWLELPPEVQKIRAPDRLILPHPRLQDRGFVLVPLCEVAPDWRHPVLDRTVREMRDALPASETAGIAPL